MRWFASFPPGADRGIAAASPPDYPIFRALLEQALSFSRYESLSPARGSDESCSGKADGVNAE
jgi:hypothetical protein